MFASYESNQKSIRNKHETMRLLKHRLNLRYGDQTRIAQLAKIEVRTVWDVLNNRNSKEDTVEKVLSAYQRLEKKRIRSRQKLEHKLNGISS